jgi:hypothetical protein
VCNDDVDPAIEAPEAAAVSPEIVQRKLAEAARFTPRSVVDITWPGQITFDVDGMPNGMTAPRVYRMTAGPEGTLAGWLRPLAESA